MGEVSTIGIDIAKSVFQLHGVDADGTVVIRARTKILEFFADLRPCLVGMKACATSHQSLSTMAFDHSSLWWLWDQHLIADPGGPTSISRTVTHRRVDRRYS